MNGITLGITIAGISLIFLIIIVCMYLIYKEHVKLDEKRNLELKNISELERESK